MERYIAIKHSLRYATVVTEIRLICSSAFFWIITFLLTLPTIILQNGSIMRKISSVTMASCLAIITFCQVVLYHEARRHERQTADQQISMEVKQRKLKEKKALKVAPQSKLAVRSLSTSMARALKTARRPRKN